MQQDHSDQSDRSSVLKPPLATSPGRECNAVGTQALPEAVEQKNVRAPDVPSEGWMRTEQIREHRRNRCSKSALGPAVTPLDGR